MQRPGRCRNHVFCTEQPALIKKEAGYYGWDESMRFKKLGCLDPDHRARHGLAKGGKSEKAESTPSIDKDEWVYITGSGSAWTEQELTRFQTNLPTSCALCGAGRSIEDPFRTPLELQCGHQICVRCYLSSSDRDAFSLETLRVKCLVCGGVHRMKRGDELVMKLAIKILEGKTDKAKLETMGGVVSQPGILTDVDNRIEIPFLDVMQKPIRGKQAIIDHAEAIMAARAEQNPRKDGRKVSVDEYASDHWLAQALDLDLDAMEKSDDRTQKQKPLQNLAQALAKNGEKKDVAYLCKDAFGEIKSNNRKRKNAAKAREKYRGGSASAEGKGATAATGTQDTGSSKEVVRKDHGTGLFAAWSAPRGGTVVTYPYWLRVRPLVDVYAEQFYEPAQEGENKWASAKMKKKIKKHEDTWASVARVSDADEYGLGAVDRGRKAVSQSVALEKNESSMPEVESRPAKFARSGSRKRSSSRGMSPAEKLSSPHLAGFLTRHEIQDYVKRLNAGELSSWMIKAKEKFEAVKACRPASKAKAAKTEAIPEETHEQSMAELPAAGTVSRFGRAKFVTVGRGAGKDEKQEQKESKSQVSTALSTQQKMKLLRKGVKGKATRQVSSEASVQQDVVHASMRRASEAVGRRHLQSMGRRVPVDATDQVKVATVLKHAQIQHHLAQNEDDTGPIREPEFQRLMHVSSANCIKSPSVRTKSESLVRGLKGYNAKHAGARKDAVIAKEKAKRLPQRPGPTKRVEIVSSQLPTISVDAGLHATISTLTAPRMMSPRHDKSERNSISDLTARRFGQKHGRKPSIPMANKPGQGAVPKSRNHLQGVITKLFEKDSKDPKKIFDYIELGQKRVSRQPPALLTAEPSRMLASNRLLGAEEREPYATSHLVSHAMPPTGHISREGPSTIVSALRSKRASGRLQTGSDAGMPVGPEHTVAGERKQRQAGRATFEYASPQDTTGEQATGAESHQSELASNSLANIPGGSVMKSPKSGFSVTESDIEGELEEPPTSALDPSNLAINVMMELIPPEHKKMPGNIFECADYWHERAYEAIHNPKTKELNFGAEQAQFKVQKKAQAGFSEDANNQALDFYFVGLRKNPSHFGCTFNAGLTYYYKGMNANAGKWFRFARLLDPSRKEPYLGEAVSSLKLDKIQHALRVLKSRPGERFHDKMAARAGDGGGSLVNDAELAEAEDLALRSEETDEAPPEARPTESQEAATHGMRPVHQLDIEDQFKFLQVICYKRANKSAISQSEYKALDKTFQQRQGLNMAMYVFTCLMLPMQVDRKVVENYVQNLIDSVAITDASAYWSDHGRKSLQRFMHHSYHIKPLWADAVLQSPTQAARFLMENQPLFRRMVRQGTGVEHFEWLLPQMSIVERTQGSIIFNEEGYVHIVLNGRVALRYHQEDPLDYQMIAQYIPGHVIGHPTIDGGVSLMGQVFPIAVSERCVLLKVRTQVFDEKIWPLTKDVKTEVKIRHLQQFKFMSELSNQTLYDIMYERKKVLRFKPARTVLACHPRSPLNAAGRDLYDSAYGQEMKDDVLKAMSNADQQQSEKLAKLSPLGSFFNMIKQRKERCYTRKQMTTAKEHWHFHSKRACARHHDATEGAPPSTFYRAIAFVLEGSCDVINTYKERSGEQFRVAELRSGDHFGASDLLQIPDIDFMGDIVAGPRGVKVLVVEAPDQVIQLYERRNLQERLKHEYDTMKIMLENKYFPGDLQNVFKNY